MAKTRVWFIGLLSMVSIVPMIFLSMLKYFKGVLYPNTITEKISFDYLFRDDTIVPAILTLLIMLIGGFTIQTLIIYYNKYLNSELSDKYQYAFIELPKELRTAIQQYLTFFNDYVEIAKKSSLKFEITQTDSGLRIRMPNTNEVKKQDVHNWFLEYMSFIKSNVENLIIKIEGNANPTEIDLLRLKLENQVASLKSSLKIAEVENNLLKDHNQFLQNLSLAFGNKDNVIHNQYIQGGSQQFADKIDNKT